MISRCWLLIQACILRSNGCITKVIKLIRFQWLWSTSACERKHLGWWCVSSPYSWDTWCLACEHLGHFLGRHSVVIEVASLKAKLTCVKTTIVILTTVGRAASYLTSVCLLKRKVLLCSEQIVGVLLNDLNFLGLLPQFFNQTLPSLIANVVPVFS